MHILFIPAQNLIFICFIVWERNNEWKFKCNEYNKLTIYMLFSILIPRRFKTLEWFAKEHSSSVYCLLLTLFGIISLSTMLELRGEKEYINPIRRKNMLLVKWSLHQHNSLLRKKITFYDNCGLQFFNMSTAIGPPGPHANVLARLQDPTPWYFGLCEPLLRADQRVLWCLTG